MCGECTFTNVYNGIIHVKIDDNFILTFYEKGQYYENGECLLFPSKECRDWSNFKKPFERGDVIVSQSGNIAIYSHFETSSYGNKVVHYQCLLSNYFNTLKIVNDCGIGYIEDCRYATKEEKERLYKALEKEGYRYNPTTKIVEVDIENYFKDGSILAYEEEHKLVVFIYKKPNTCNTSYYCAYSQYTLTTYTHPGEGLSGNRKDLRFAKPEEVKLLISKLRKVGYDWDFATKQLKQKQKKLDISTLKPFDKVLVRQNNTNEWFISLFDRFLYEEQSYRFKCLNNCRYIQCIPYEDNKHLLGTTNEPNDFFVTWE